MLDGFVPRSLAANQFARPRGQSSYSTSDSTKPVSPPRPRAAPSRINLLVADKGNLPAGRRPRWDVDDSLATGQFCQHANRIAAHTGKAWRPAAMTKVFRFNERVFIGSTCWFAVMICFAKRNSLKPERFSRRTGLAGRDWQTEWLRIAASKSAVLGPTPDPALPAVAHVPVQPAFKDRPGFCHFSRQSFPCGC
jgi:hypothetical protein